MFSGVGVFPIVISKNNSCKEIVAIELAANESKFEWFWPGIDSANGISIDHIAGALDITVFYITVT